MTARTDAPPTAGGALRFPPLAADAREAEPFALALPLPQAALRDPADFRLLDGAASLPLQARATSHWPDGSVRWLYARAQVDLPGRAAKEIAWAATGAGSPGEATPPATPVAREPAAGWVVDTGRLRALVPADGGALLREITLDGAPIGGALGPFRLDAAPAAGAAGDAPGAADAPPSVGPTITLEEAGPVAATLRLDGWHEPGVWRRSVRLTFHAGKPYVTVAHRFTLHDQSGPRHLRALAVDWSPAPAGDAPRLALGQAHYRAATRSGTGAVAGGLGPGAMFGQELGPDLFYGDFWASHTGATGGVGLTIHQAFQHFPVGLAATPEGLRAELVPAGGEGVAIRPGVARTHRLQVHFHAAGTPLEALSFRSLQFQLPDEPIIPAATYAAAGVWPDIFPARRSEAIEWFLSRRADERVIALGMLDFGDAPDSGYTAQRRGGDDWVWTNNEYDFAHAMYLNWARTGERRYRGAGDVAARHWLDVDICHASPDPLRLGGHITHSAHHVSGEEEALAAAIGVGDNILRLLAQPSFRKAGGFQVRELGWALVALAALHQETREERFLAESARLVDQFVAWREEFGGLLAPYTSHTMVRVPFMIAVAALGLLRYHEQRPDPRIPPLVVGEVDALIEECMGPEGIFNYKGLPSLHRPHPNPLLLGLLAQAYRLSGEPRYLDIAATQLRWMLRPAGGYERQSGVFRGSFLRGVGLAGPKGFAQARLP